MKTILGALLTLGLLSSTASAQWCPPGEGYGQRSSFGHGLHRNVHATRVPVVATSAPAIEAPAPEASVAPADPAPAVQQPAEEAPPK
jgi:hypothetical protein